MKFFYQRMDNDCGITCAEMLLGKRLIGDKYVKYENGLSINGMKAMLTNVGLKFNSTFLKSDSRMRLYDFKNEGKQIVLIKRENRYQGGHFIILWKDKIYDPYNGISEMKDYIYRTKKVIAIFDILKK